MSDRALTLVNFIAAITLLACVVAALSCGVAPTEPLTVQVSRPGIEVTTSTCGWYRRDCDSDCDWICDAAPNDDCVAECLDRCHAREPERFCHDD